MKTKKPVRAKRLKLCTICMPTWVEFKDIEPGECEMCGRHASVMHQTLKKWRLP